MEDHPLNYLPQEITLNIFSRLPVESVLDCKLVCKPWRDLLQFHANTYFAYLHLRRQQEEQQDTLQKHDGSATTSFVGLHQQDLSYYVKHNDDHETNYCVNSTRRRINLKFPKDVSEIVGSCNGLICLSKKYKRTLSRHSRLSTHGNSVSDEALYICNPITREYVSLPESQIGKNGSSAYIVHGFGYHPLTNEYKVIRIFYPVAPDLPGQCEVYTLGSDSGWRSAGEIYHHIQWFGVNAKSVCVDGAFYWVCQGSRDIFAFDLADEKFYWLLPPPRTSTGTYQLCVFRGCLGLLHEYSANYFGLDEECADLWFYKPVNEGETSTSSSSYRTKCKSWSYSKGFGHFSEDEAQDLYNFCYWIESSLRTPHINSFLSLKALGENNVKIYKGYQDRKRRFSMLKP